MKKKNKILAGAEPIAHGHVEGPADEMKNSNSGRASAATDAGLFLSTFADRATLPHPGPLPLGEGELKGSATAHGAARLVQRFTSDSVTVETPGNSETHTRVEVEGWLAGMDAARRRASEEACREAVAITIKSKGNRSNHGNLIAVFASLAAAAGLLIQPRAAIGAEIIRGFAPVDGQQLYAADLDNLIDESVIGVQFYNDQQTTPVLGSGYYFLVLNPANQTYYRINAQQVLYGNTNIFLNLPAEPVPAYGLLEFFDPTNGWVASTTVSNFLWNSASNINVAALSFANTNNGGATNAYVLPLWPYAWTGSSNGNPVFLLTWNTNGAPYQEPLSNAEKGVAADFGTNLYLPWGYRQMFLPWQVEGTNVAAPYTNSFGWTTNFPITAYLEANNGNTLTNATLTDTDTIPVSSYTQGVATTGNPTNTAMSLLALYEYMTNKNALPPYTLARTQFSGIVADGNCPGSAGITNMSNITGIITNVALAINFTNPTPVSFQGASIMMPTVPPIFSNTVYWAEVTNAPVLGTVPAFQIFTNFANAEARVNPIQGNGVNPVNDSTLLYLTNYTAVNCVSIQLCDAATVEAGWYGIYFTNGASQTPFYYLTGSGMASSGNFWNTSVSFLNDGIFSMITTNGFWMLTSAGNSTPVNSPLVHVLVQPQ